jgi:hypothetical protein
MKRSMGLAIFTLMVLGCSAAFGQVQLGFLDSDGVTQYCDYEVFSYGTSLASGIDVGRPCNENDGTMIGVVDSGIGGYVSGTVVVFADSAIDAMDGTYTGYQALLITQTKVSKNHYGWEYLYNDYDDFAIYLSSYGYLTKHTGALAPLTEGHGKSLAGSRSHAVNLLKK